MPSSFNPIQGAEALTPAIRPNFADTYRKRYQGVLADMGSVMELAVPSDKFQEVYGYPETAMYPQRVPDGEGMPSKSHRYRSFTITNVTWKASVQWFRNQALFDQLGTVIKQARQAGENFANLPEEVFFQVIQQQTNARLLRTIPNAPDGAAIYATTDGAGSNRFGVSSGNLVTGTGVATSEAIRTDYFSAITQFALMQDTEGQPLLPANILDQGFTLFYNASNEKIVSEAFLQLRSLAGSVVPTNIVQDANKVPRLVGTQRITDNDMYVFANGVDTKAVIEQVASPLEEMPSNVGNSDFARDYDVESFNYKAVRGYGVGLPYGTVKINN